MLRNFLNFFIDAYHYLTQKASTLARSILELKSPPDEKTRASDQALDNEEKKSKKKPARRVVPFKKNITAALKLPMTAAKLDELRTEPGILLHMCKDYIKEHSARRVDIYFYLLIAVYNTQCILKQDSTILQHGKGRKTQSRVTVSHACHSNLFPNLQGLKKNTNKAPEMNIFNETHFMDTMNITSELPIFVNQLDSELEGKINNPSLFRKKSFNILQSVSNGEIDPVEGFRQFLKNMNDTLLFLEKGQSHKKNHYLSRKSGPMKSVKLELLKIVKAGMCCENDDKFNDFIQLHLRLNDYEILQCQISSVLKQKIYREKMSSIQKEIFETKSQLIKRKR
jgi:hypothetical protein